MSGDKTSNKARQTTKRLAKNLLQILACVFALQCIIEAVFMSSYINQINKFRRIESYVRQNGIEPPEDICQDLVQHDTVLRNFSMDYPMFWRREVTTNTKLQLSYAHEQTLLAGLYSTLLARELATKLLPEAIYFRIDPLPYARSLVYVREQAHHALFRLEEVNIALRIVTEEVKKPSRHEAVEQGGSPETSPSTRLQTILSEYKTSLDDCASILNFGRLQFHKVTAHMGALAAGEAAGEDQAQLNAIGKPLIAALHRLNQDDLGKGPSTISWFHRECFRATNNKDYPQQLLALWNTAPYLRPDFRRYIRVIFGLPETEDHVLEYEAWH